jgi:hypothetical protein
MVDALLGANQSLEAIRKSFEEQGLMADRV